MALRLNTVPRTDACDAIVDQIDVGGPGNLYIYENPVPSTMGNGAYALIRTLVNAGVDTCFTNPGTSEMHFVAALDQVPGMRSVLVLFEGVATGAADGTVKLWQPPTTAAMALAKHAAAVTAIAVTGDGKLSVSAGADKSIQIFDAATGQARLVYDALTVQALVTHRDQRITQGAYGGVLGDDRNRIAWKVSQV